MFRLSRVWRDDFSKTRLTTPAGISSSRSAASSRLISSMALTSSTSENAFTRSSRASSDI